MDVRGADLPVLFRLINTVHETLPLFLLREVQEQLDDLGTVAMEMRFELVDRSVAIAPEMSVVQGVLRQILGVQYLGMHPDDQDVLVIGAQGADASCARGNRASAPRPWAA